MPRSRGMADGCPSSVDIRRAGIGDLEDYLRLYYGFYSELRAKQGWGPCSLDEYRADAARHLREDAVFLAVGDGAAIGFVRISEREGSFWIEEIYVDEGRRGCGIGSRLVKAAESYIAKFDASVYVMVLPQDREAIEFWLHMGYRTLNSIELARDLRRTGRAEGETVPFMGHPMKVWRWRRETFTEEELEYLRAVEEFYRRGGTRRRYLQIVSEALRRWAERGG